MPNADGESPRAAGRVLFARRVLHRRCPQCGDGALFRSYATLAKTCDRCDLVYRREQGAMTGSMYLSAGLTEVFAALLALVLFFATDWSVAISLAVAIPLVIAFAFWWFPYAAALWVAVEYSVDVSNHEAWARPR